MTATAKTITVKTPSGIAVKLHLGATGFGLAAIVGGEIPGRLPYDIAACWGPLPTPRERATHSVRIGRAAVGFGPAAAAEIDDALAALQVELDAADPGRVARQAEQDAEAKRARLVDAVAAAREQEATDRARAWERGDEEAAVAGGTSSATLRARAALAEFDRRRAEVA